MALAALPATALSVAFARAGRQLTGRLLDLEARLPEGDTAWEHYLTTLRLVLDLEARLAPGGRGELITTADLANRLNVSPKTILRRKKTGALTLALAEGKLIRWKATEAVR